MQQAFNRSQADKIIRFATGSALNNYSAVYQKELALILIQAIRHAVENGIYVNLPVHSEGMERDFGRIRGFIVILGIWEAALFKKISLSERSEFEIFLNAFSNLPNALELHGSETKPEIPSHSFASLLKKLMEKNKK